ncbi:MAG TPA: TonB-dependent receptor plug domain-containing protein [Gemmatimonadaceae bacterium]
MRSAGGVGGRLLGAIALLAVARALPAQARPCATSPDTGAAVHWGAPLDRPVTLHVNEQSLRNALDRLATTAKLKLSYSAEFLPLDREVCVSADTEPVGEVLSRLLARTNVSPIPVGGDQVVLAPRAPSPTRTVEPPDMSSTLNVLDRVVVTGSATAAGAPERELTVGVNVLSGRQLTRQNTNTISDALDAYVPGIWTWTQSPSSMLSSYASIRGASSFGLSYPKIYVDGIEVANPLLLSRFNPGSIDRIEVIRGPQGSALYGTDAISGVVNIVTRHDGADGDGRNMVVRSTAGFAQSQYGHDVVTQDHTLSVIAGSSTRSADLHVEAGGMGSFVPDGYSQNLTATGGARFVGSRGTLSTTVRLFTQRAGSPDSPLVAVPSIPTSDSSRGNAPQSVTEYTVGVTGTLDGGNHWLHSFVAGIDGYNLANVQTNFTPVPSVADSALRAAQGSAARGTLRASSVLELGAGGPTHGSLTFSAEHAMLRVSSIGPTTMVGPSPSSHDGPGTTSTAYLPKLTWQTSTGLTTQANAAFDNVLFATAGLRIERDSRLSDDHPIAALPMLGVASVRDYGPFSVKVRAAYGKGIRPPTTTSRSQLYQPRNTLTAELSAEEQTGTELGIDVVLRRGLSLNLTRFDQRASGLIQQVAVASSQQEHRMSYELQNVGAISNSGWELEATGNLSRLSATGALTFVDSRVGQLSPTYTGDLRQGDRMLQVPATTASFNLAWDAPRWTASIGGSRAFNWINYDELQLANDWLNDSRPTRDLTGPNLRQYWRRYNGGFRLRASLSRDLRRDLSFELTGDNLLNYQRGEPDDITIVPGRTILTGLRLKF